MYCTRPPPLTLLLQEKEDFLVETLAAEKEAARVLSHENSALNYRNQNLQKRLEDAESENLSSAVKSASENPGVSPTRGFRIRGSWSPLPVNQKGEGSVGEGSSVVQRMREENERLQGEKLRLKDEVVEARLESSVLLAKLEASAVQANDSTAKMAKAGHAHRLLSSEHWQVSTE